MSDPAIGRRTSADRVPPPRGAEPPVPGAVPPERDAGPPVPSAVPPQRDAGPPERDAGPPEHGAGSPERGAGSARRGAGPVRLVAVGAAVATVALGLAVRAFAGGAVAKYGADALYTVLLYTLLVALAPRIRPVVAGAVALAISVAVEFFQLTDVPATLSAHSVVARLVLGSTFNAPDLLWYAVGAAGAGLFHVALRRVAQESSGSGRSE